MATKPNCDVTGVLNEVQASCVKDHVAGLIPVEYVIHFDTTIRLPYGIYWNGDKQPTNRGALTTGGSDASPQFRQELLFPVTVGHNDMRVVIQSQAGLHDYSAEVSTNESDIQRDVQEAGRPDKLDIYKGN